MQVTKKHAAKFTNLTKTVLQFYKESKEPRSWRNLFGLMKRDLVREPLDSVLTLGYKEFAKGESPVYYAFNTSEQKWFDNKGNKLSPASHSVISKITISDFQNVKAI